MTDNRTIYQTAFTKKLEQLGIAYRLADKSVICFSWGEAAASYELRFTDSRATLTAVNLGGFTAATLSQGYQLCARLNSEVKWLKFVIDRQGQLLGLVDTALNTDEAMEEIMELLARMSTALAEKQSLICVAQRRCV